ncbi:hypothetical protein UFOVP1639_5 [uncultured Caudovirales phage]|uniref:Uncharacterized protein n=1 Tax=uncultured Caudovirales phage TaxID=2100421 RepID=A0A6J5SWQ0_9CAUD|nr:hypothetical protein UFOVP1639_5 [uncultured Caudovirales phage]
MREVFLIAQKNSNPARRVNYVYRNPSNKLKLHGRYVLTTTSIRSAKRFKTIEAANQEIANFKKLNFLTNWEVVVVSIDTARIKASV